ncbi:hypothetical protein [Spirosoma panaciterrae]|uniref:hypothetical protein n=1 Tax=Spirosoma panaciterrae TaxID=496058 RepID=UPI0003798B7C|nr:hypothetical protein [Spirosoma panaciterrae]
MKQNYERSSPLLNEWHNLLFEQWSAQDKSMIVPMIYPEPNVNSLLFVGINPSYNAQHIRRVLQGSRFADSLMTNNDVDNFFRFDILTIRSKISDFQEIQRLHHDSLRYFDRHRQTAQLLNMPWEQADLFQLRQSVQHEFTQLITQLEQREFAADQIRLFFELLVIQAPRIIIAANGEVTRFFTKRSKLLNRLFSQFTVESTDTPNVIVVHYKTLKVPVVLSSQFTHYMSNQKREFRIQQEVDLIKTILKDDLT